MAKEVKLIETIITSQSVHSYSIVMHDSILQNFMYYTKLRAWLPQ